MWENRSNDYDICIKCAQASRFIEMILNKEEELILKIIKKVDSQVDGKDIKANGIRYEGGYKDGKHEGQGTKTFDDGSQYQG